MVRLHTIPQISRSSRSGIWGLYGCTWVDTIRSFPLSYEDDKNNHGYKRKTYFGWQFHKRAQESRSGFRESDSETGGLGLTPIQSPSTSQKSRCGGGGSRPLFGRSGCHASAPRFWLILEFTR